MSLIWGKNWHIFKPTQISADDEENPIHVLIQQARYFGPFPLSYEDFIDAEQNRILICKIMKLDPRDRSTAKQLLQDGGFQQP